MRFYNFLLLILSIIIINSCFPGPETYIITQHNYYIVDKDGNNLQYVTLGGNEVRFSNDSNYLIIRKQDGIYRCDLDGNSELITKIHYKNIPRIRINSPSSIIRY